MDGSEPNAPCSLHLAPKGMAGQVLFNVWMEGIVYDCILLVVLMGLRTMELWEIMTSSDVRAIAQYLKKNFSKFWCFVPKYGTYYQKMVHNFEISKKLCKLGY